MHTRATVNWDDLRFFLAVARNRSTKAAARSLLVNQSTVHRRLDELEGRLGHQLAIRSSTGYRLSELGQDVFKHAARMEQAADAFERRVSAWGQQYVGTVGATCPEALAPRLVRSGFIERFNAKYPDIRLELVMSDRSLIWRKVRQTSPSEACPRLTKPCSGAKLQTHAGQFTEAAHMQRVTNALKRSMTSTNMTLSSLAARCATIRPIDGFNRSLQGGGLRRAQTAYLRCSWRLNRALGLRLYPSSSEMPNPSSFGSSGPYPIYRHRSTC
jgi:hypothetical protein